MAYTFCQLWLYLFTLIFRCFDPQKPPVGHKKYDQNGVYPQNVKCLYIGLRCVACVCVQIMPMFRPRHGVHVWWMSSVLHWLSMSAMSVSVCSSACTGASTSPATSPPRSLATTTPLPHRNITVVQTRLCYQLQLDVETTVIFDNVSKLGRWDNIYKTLLRQRRLLSYLFARLFLVKCPYLANTASW